MDVELRFELAISVVVCPVEILRVVWSPLAMKSVGRERANQSCDTMSFSN